MALKETHIARTVRSALRRFKNKEAVFERFYLQDVLLNLYGPKNFGREVPAE